MEVSSIPWYVKSCDKYEVLHFHPSLGFEDALCEKPIYHATHLQHAAWVEDPFWHRIQVAAVDPDRLDQGGNYDMALSFQERAGCDKIWEVQRKGNSVYFTQNLV